MASALRTSIWRDVVEQLFHPYHLSRPARRLFPLADHAASTCRRAPPAPGRYTEVIVRRETEPIEARASPRNPNVAIRNRSAAEPAWRWHAARSARAISSAGMPPVVGNLHKAPACPSATSSSPILRLRPAHSQPIPYNRGGSLHHFTGGIWDETSADSNLMGMESLELMAAPRS